jgi:hypothetical protein
MLLHAKGEQHEQVSLSGLVATASPWLDRPIRTGYPEARKRQSRIK